MLLQAFRRYLVPAQQVIIATKGVPLTNQSLPPPRVPMLRAEGAKWVTIVLLDQLHKFHVLQVKRVQHQDLQHLIPIARQVTTALLKPQLRLL